MAPNIVFRAHDHMPNQTSMHTLQLQPLGDGRVETWCTTTKT